MHREISDITILLSNIFIWLQKRNKKFRKKFKIYFLATFQALKNDRVRTLSSLTNATLDINASISMRR